MVKKIWRVAVLCLLAMTATSTRAQFSGNVSGDVRDQSAAPIAGASVTLTNTLTGESLSTKSDASGSFRFVSLAPGTYKIAASASG